MNATPNFASPSGQKLDFRPRLRICFNTPNPALRGGPPTHLPALARALSERVDLHEYEYGRKSDGETLGQKVLGRLGDLRRIRSLCRHVRPDLIHLNSAFDYKAILRDAPLVLLAKQERIPIFIKVHGSLPEAFDDKSWLIKKARRVVLTNATCIGVLSEAEKKEFEGAFPYVQGKVCVVKNPIRAEFTGVRRQEADRPTVLFLSRFIRGKGPFDLLRAALLVLKEQPDTEFLFVGDGEQAQAFDRKVEQMNLLGPVRRISHASEAGCLDLYSRSWMLVFPSHFPEGMPMVVGEAMAAGVPIVSTPTRFARSYLTEGVHLLYNAIGDAKGMAENILKLCRESALRMSMSDANRKFAKELFALPSVTQEYVDLYADILRNQESFRAEEAREAANSVSGISGH
jgi:glycosyltransferase involved in cell wall biosynthesis